jgi:hypothetical protein
MSTTTLQHPHPPTLADLARIAHVIDGQGCHHRSTDDLLLSFSRLCVRTFTACTLQEEVPAQRAALKAARLHLTTTPVTAVDARHAIQVLATHVAPYVTWRQRVACGPFSRLIIAQLTLLCLARCRLLFESAGPSPSTSTPDEACGPNQ